MALVNQAPTKVSVVELTASLLSFIKFIFERFQGFPDSSVGKEYTCSAGNPGLIPGSGRYPGERNGYPLQYSGLENSMDCIVHGVSDSDTTEQL